MVIVRFGGEECCDGSDEGELTMVKADRSGKDLVDDKFILSILDK